MSQLGKRTSQSDCDSHGAHYLIPDFHCFRKLLRLQQTGHEVDSAHAAEGDGICRGVKGQVAAGLKEHKSSVKIINKVSIVENIVSTCSMRHPIEPKRLQAKANCDIIP